ncbi:MAG: xanthine phosphoribosyltransferase [Bacilli bacterium]|nr:xanthine phosphoribosyltransferase [Bacilli bacterium]
MKELEKEILEKGIIINSEIVKIDSFLNHQINIELFMKIAQHFKKHFGDRKVDKIMTIETSGIALAFAAALEFKTKNLVFAKKNKSAITGDNVYKSEVYSFTKKKTNTITIDKMYVQPGENILIVDDFLAAGSAGCGLIDICRQAGANVVGFAVAVEKSFQGGRKKIEDLGVKVYSGASIKSIENGTIIFDHH